jgi:hypothetical protein
MSASRLCTLSEHYAAVMCAVHELVVLLCSTAATVRVANEATYCRLVALLDNVLSARLADKA